MSFDTETTPTAIHSETKTRQGPQDHVNIYTHTSQDQDIKDKGVNPCQLTLIQNQNSH